MKVDHKNPPRTFRCGADASVEIHDCGSIRLESDEQVTFLTENGRAHDFVAKSWGFYVTPSVNGRLRNEGFRTALTSNQQGRLYVVVVEEDKIAEFTGYLAAEDLELVEWLDERTVGV